MVRGSVVLEILVNAPSGTAFDGVEVVATFGVLGAGDNAVMGGVSAAIAGV